MRFLLQHLHQQLHNKIVSLPAVMGLTEELAVMVGRVLAVRVVVEEMLELVVLEEQALAAVLEKQEVAVVTAVMADKEPHQVVVVEKVEEVEMPKLTV